MSELEPKKRVSLNRDGANMLDTPNYMRGLANGSLEDRVKEVKTKKVEINQSQRDSKFDFSDLGIGRD